MEGDKHVFVTLLYCLMRQGTTACVCIDISGWGVGLGWVVGGDFRYVWGRWGWFGVVGVHMSI